MQFFFGNSIYGFVFTSEQTHFPVLGGCDHRFSLTHRLLSNFPSNLGIAANGWRMRADAPSNEPHTSFNMLADDVVRRNVAVFGFRCCSWNILADGYARQTSFPYCSSRYLDWNHRKNLIKSFLEDAHADILCLQEVDHPEFFKNELGTCEFTLLTAIRPDKDDGCLIAFDNRKFSMVPGTHRVVQFNDLANNYKKSSERARVTRDNVGHFVLLAPKFSTSSQFSAHPCVMVCNTHLFWNPEFEDVKLQQMVFFVQNISKFIEDYVLERQKVNSHDPAPGVAVAICGDFNSVPSSAVYQFLADGTCDRSADMLRRRPRLVLDHPIHKMSKWLRILGIDVTCHSKDAPGGYDALFKMARDERRTIITKNKKLTERRGCPRSYIVRGDSHLESLKYLLTDFRAEIFPSSRTDSNCRSSTCSSCIPRCLNCNSTLNPVMKEDLIGGEAVPSVVLEPNSCSKAGSPYVFYMCCDDECGAVFYWGQDSNLAKDKFPEVYAVALEAACEVRHRSHRDNGESRVSACHSLGLQSAYYDYCKRGEPKYTNYTGRFKDCLDYVFYTPVVPSHPNQSPSDWKMERVGVIPLLSEEVASANIALPSKSIPSDHLLIGADFELSLTSF